MGTGRSLPNFQRIYVGGYDLSGYAMDSGEQGVEYTENEGYTWTDAIKGIIASQPKYHSARCKQYSIAPPR